VPRVYQEEGSLGLPSVLPLSQAPCGRRCQAQEVKKSLQSQFKAAVTEARPAGCADS